MNFKWKLGVLIFFIATSSYFVTIYARSYWHPLYLNMTGKRTTNEVINEIGPKVEPQLKSLFQAVNLNYPPNKLAFYAIKNSKLMELWAKHENHWKKVKTYPILKTSGQLGPKLREGDRQVPEGIYKIIGLNPNSAYHLSMKLNYPNDFDLEKAKSEGRDQPGSNIFIHGKEVSIGCLAMGDNSIEELFTLVYRVGWQNTEVIISPSDARIETPKIPPKAPIWTSELYQQIVTASRKYKE